MSLTISPTKIVEASKSPLLAAPDSWTRWPLGEVAMIVNGFAFKSKQFIPGAGKPLIRIRDMFNEATSVGYVGDYDDEYIVQPGQLIVGMDGDFNATLWRGPEALLNQRVCKIIPDTAQLDLDFLAYVLPGYLQAIRDVTSSTTVRHLSSRDIAQIPIPVPSLREQRAVAQLAGTISSKQGLSALHLATARKAISRFRQSVLAAACAGRLTADWREANGSEESGRALAERSKRLLPARSRRSVNAEPIAEPDWLVLPESWSWSPLGDLAEIRGGIQKQPKRVPKSNAYPYLRVANVLRGRLSLSEIQRFELFDGELETYRLEPGDLLVVEGNGSANEIGRCALWNGEIPDCVHQNHIIRARIVAMLPRFVELFWNSPIGSREVASRAVTSAGLYSLTARKIGSVPVPVAPLDEQREVVRRVDGLFAVADSLANRIENAARRVERSSQAVLAKAFRGELALNASAKSAGT